jgi:predicted MPP superfamily phosphohydrolase
MASLEIQDSSREQGEDVAQNRRGIIRAVGYVAGLGLLATPAAAFYGISHAEADDYLGANKTHFSVTTQGKTELDFGPVGEMTIPLHKGIFGIRAEVKGIATDSHGPLDVPTLFSPDTLSKYAGLYGDPKEAVNGVEDLLIEDAIQKGLAAEAIALAGIALLVGGGSVVIRDDFKQKRLLTPLVTAGLLAAEVASIASVTAAPASSSKETNVNVISSLDGTYFKGSTTSDEPLRSILDKAIPTIKKLGNRQNNFLEEYQTTAKLSLESQKNILATPLPNEEVIMTFSDLHCSYAMIPLLKDVADLYQPKTVISSGDDTNFGSALEKGCIQKEGTITEPKHLVVSGGNHDSKTTEKQMSDVGMKNLGGKTLDINGTTVLGDDDPEITPPLTSGYRIFEDKEETEEDFGKRILKQALEDQPDVITLHQPKAVQPIIDFIKSAESESRVASLVLNGHMHRRDGPYVLWNADGTWTVQYQMGTAGGVGTATLTTFSTPFSKPLTPGETTIFFKDKESRLITGYQILIFETDGKITVTPRVSVGSSDGLPLSAEQTQPEDGKNFVKALRR